MSYLLCVRRLLLVLLLMSVSMLSVFAQPRGEDPASDAATLQVRVPSASG